MIIYVLNWGGEALDKIWKCVFKEKSSNRKQVEKKEAAFHFVNSVWELKSYLISVTFILIDSSFNIILQLTLHLS